MKVPRVFLMMVLGIILIGLPIGCSSNPSDSATSANVPLGKKVCVVYSNVFHTVDGTLEAWAKPLLDNPNLKKAVWEENSNGFWILRMNTEDPVTKERHKIDWAINSSKNDPNYVCVTRIVVDGKEASSSDVMSTTAQIAMQAGLEFR